MLGKELDHNFQIKDNGSIFHFPARNYSLCISEIICDSNGHHKKIYNNPLYQVLDE